MIHICRIEIGLFFCVSLTLAHAQWPRDWSPPHKYAHRRVWSVRSIGIGFCGIAGGGILPVVKSKTILIIRTTFITDDRIFHRRRHTFVRMRPISLFSSFDFRFPMLHFGFLFLVCGSRMWFASKRLSSRWNGKCRTKPQNWNLKRLWKSTQREPNGIRATIEYDLVKQKNDWEKSYALNCQIENKRYALECEAKSATRQSVQCMCGPFE